MIGVRFLIDPTMPSLSLDERLKTIALFLSLVIGTTASIYRFITWQLRRQVRHANKERGETRAADNPVDTGQVIYKLVEPELKRQHVEYGDRLADLRARLDEHLVKAEPAMKELTEVIVRVRALEQLRREDKDEIIAEIRESRRNTATDIQNGKTEMDARLGRIEDHLRSNS